MEHKAAYMQKPWLKYYSEGIPWEMEIPEISIPDAFDEATEKWEDKTALIFYGKKSVTVN